MKKLFLFAFYVLLVSFCFGETNKLNLNDFFSDNNYCTEKIDFDSAEINYSYQYAEGSTKIVSKAVFYMIDNGEMIPLLIFDNDHIYNSSELLFHGNVAAQKFYGWNIRINKNNGSVSADFYTNNGKNATDGPSFNLDKKTMKYKRFMMDPSEY